MVRQPALTDVTMHQFIEKMLTEDECNLLIRIYNSATGQNIHLGTLPFLRLYAMRKALKHMIDRDFLASQVSYPEVEELYKRLDEDQYWVDMSTLSDYPNRRMYNTVTCEYRIDIAL